MLANVHSQSLSTREVLLQTYIAAVFSLVYKPSSDFTNWAQILQTFTTLHREGVRGSYSGYTAISFSFIEAARSHQARAR